MKKISKYFLRGTPALLLPLGAGFVIASSKDIRAALGMGVCVLVITLLSALVISGIRNLVPEYSHLPIYVLVVTGFTTLVSMLMEAYYPEVVNMLGVHLAALAVSAVPYRDCEEVAGVNDLKTTFLTSLITGIFFTLIMLATALVREVLGNATFAGNAIAFLQDYKVSFLVTSAGGFVVLAVLVAIINKVADVLYTEKEDK